MGRKMRLEGPPKERRPSKQLLEEESSVKKLLENKAYGYYVTLALSVLSVVVAVVCAVMYSGSR